MKVVTILLLVWVGSPIRLVADLLTYRFTGVVLGEGTQGRFAVGRPYTLTVTMDTAVPGVATIPERKDYTAAIASWIFNYDSGNYLAEGTNTGKMSVENDERGLYDHFQIFALPGFSPVGGQPHAGSWLRLTDTSHLAFASTELPRALPVDAFPLRDFNITWGIDYDTRWLSLSIDSISLIQRRPEITAWNRTTDSLVLTIEFPNKPYTNLVERCFQLDPTPQWDIVSSFVASGGGTNWTVPLETGPPAVFYRVRGQ